MSFADLLSKIFRRDKKPKPDLAAARAQDAEFARTMDEGRVDSYRGAVSTPIPEDFRAPYTAPQIMRPGDLPPMSPMSAEAAPPKPKSSAIQRGISGLLGFVPKGGTQGDAADGFANIGRALMGFDSVQQMESDYNQSIAPEKLRRALETGDVEAIKRLDPETAAQVQGVDETTYTGDRQRQLDEAIAAGDIEAMRRFDPTKADELENTRNVERLGRARMLAAAVGEISGGDPEKAAAALQALTSEQQNLLTPQEMMAFEQGGVPALEAMLGAEEEEQILNLGGGSIYDTKTKEFKTAPRTPQELSELDRAEIELRRAQARNLDRQNLPGQTGKGGTAEDKEGFTASLNNLAETAVELAAAGAIGSGGEGSRNPYWAALVGAPGTEKGPNWIQGVAQLFGAEWANKFSAREAQVASAVRGFSKAAGIASTSMNSNFELRSVQETLANPFSPMEDQIAATDAMSMQYGDGTRTADYLLQSGQITDEQYADIVSKTQSFGRTIQIGVAKAKAFELEQANNPDSDVAAAAEMEDGVYTDAEKEKRYQEWLESTGR